MIEKTAVFYTEEFQLKLPESFEFSENLQDADGYLTFSLRLSWSELGIQGDMSIHPGDADSDGDTWDCFLLTIIPGPEEFELKLALVMRPNTFFDNTYRVYESWDLDPGQWDEEESPANLYLNLTNQSYPSPVTSELSTAAEAEKELELAWKSIQALLRQKFEFRIK